MRCMWLCHQCQLIDILGLWVGFCQCKKPLWIKLKECFEKVVYMLHVWICGTVSVWSQGGRHRAEVLAQMLISFFFNAGTSHLYIDL